MSAHRGAQRRLRGRGHDHINRTRRSPRRRERAGTAFLRRSPGALAGRATGRGVVPGRHQTPHLHRTSGRSAARFGPVDRDRTRPRPPDRRNRRRPTLDHPSRPAGRPGIHDRRRDHRPPGFGRGLLRRGGAARRPAGDPRRRHGLRRRAGGGRRRGTGVAAHRPVAPGGPGDGGDRPPLKRGLPRRRHVRHRRARRHRRRHRRNRAHRRRPRPRLHRLPRRVVAAAAVPRPAVGHDERGRRRGI